jgi:hypothetical protein
MYIPITIAALALMTVAMVLLQAFWLRVPPRLRSFLIRASIALIVLQAFFAATKWGTTSNHLNAFIYWLAVVGYELLVLLFSRLSPRWLTVPSAAILLVPLFASVIVISLSHFFEPDTHKSAPLGDHLFYDVRPWSNTGAGNAGVDVNIYYRPSLVPFLRRKIGTIPLNDQECNSSAAFAISDPAAKTILGRCPYWPSQPTGFFDKPLPPH